MDKTVSNGMKIHHNVISVLKELELYENRFVGCCLWGEDQGILFSNDKMYPVDVEAYSKVCGTTRSKAFKDLLEIIRKLKETSFDIKLPDNSVYVTSIVYDFLYKEENKTILVNWNKKFIPLISGNMEAGKFMVLDKRIASISSNKRYLMYILIEKNLWKLSKQDLFFIEKQEIRDVLNLLPEEYTEFKSLHAKVIKPTLKDIYNKLGIGLETSIRGSKVLFNYKKEVKEC